MANSTSSISATARVAFTKAVTKACPQALILGFIGFRLSEDKTAFYSLWREYGAPYRLSMREFRYWKLVYRCLRPYNVRHIARCLYQVTRAASKPHFKTGS